MSQPPLKRPRTSSSSSSSAADASSGARSSASNTRKLHIIFAHGAGTNSSHPWMQEWAQKLRELFRGDGGRECRVHLFDYRKPWQMEKLKQQHLEVVRRVVSEAQREGGLAAEVDVVLIGKSMGSRVGIYVANELAGEGRDSAAAAAAEEPSSSETEEDGPPSSLSSVGSSRSHPQRALVRCAITLGYPLVGGNGELRNEVLEANHSTPVLFVSGTRDKMCPLDRLESVRQKMTAPSRLYRVETGDHGLATLKRHSLTQAESDALILEEIKAFVEEHTQED